MHVFVTGGSGTIGSAVVAELLGNGHTVLALARSDSSERSLKEAGAEVLRGGLADRDVLQAGAGQADGVISLAFSPHYQSADGLAAAITEESAAVAALGEELIGSDRPIVTVSGTPWVTGRASPRGSAAPRGTGCRESALRQRAPRAGLAGCARHGRSATWCRGHHVPASASGSAARRSAAACSAAFRPKSPW